MSTFAFIYVALNHSIQNIFIQVGQYDRYAIFDFYFGSEAYLAYGATVYGYILYTPTQRANLTTQTRKNPVPDEDGLILLDGALQDEEKNKRLRSIGFMAKDVNRLSTLDIGQIRNHYEYQGTREIPNTINVKFDASRFDADALQLKLFRERIAEGIPFIPFEYVKYLTLLKLLEPQDLDQAKEYQYLRETSTGQFNKDVIIIILG